MQPLTSYGDGELIAFCVTEGTPAAWREFVARFQKLLALRIHRVLGSQVSRETVDDLVQDTLMKISADSGKLLLPLVGESDEGIRAYLRVIAAHMAQDYIRRIKADVRRPDFDHADVDAPEIQSALSSNRTAQTAERELLFHQIDQHLIAMTEGNERDRNVFWLYFRVGLTAAAIAEQPGIGLQAKGVESTIHRLVQGLRTRLGCDFRKGKPARNAF
ncbi:MAG TPA: sigma-70 family RNA polymerase sigma factor [Terriglobales bacterium]|jgi:RNA polymerase sigma-70 factor (ECF subfamily)